MDFFVSFSNMSMVLFAIAVGFLAHKLGIMTDETNRKMTKLLLTITMPCMTLGALRTSEELPDFGVVLGILEAALAFYAAEFLLAAFLPRLLGGAPLQRSVWRFALCFPNVGFIGIPVCTAFFGPEAMIYAVILILPFNLLSYSLGPLILSGGFRNFRLRELLSPAVVSSLIALVMTLMRVRPPQLVGDWLNFVGDMTTPLSLIVIGSLLADMPIREALASPRLWIVAAIRLVVLPVVLFAILQPLHLAQIVVNVAVLQIAMPVAANGSMLAMEYGGDVRTMARITFLTTLCSMITVPVLASVLLG